MQPNTTRKPGIPGPKLPGPKLPGPKLPGKVPVQAVPSGNAVVTKPKPTSMAMSITPPKLSELPASQLPKLGNRFVAVRVSVAVPHNARQSRKIVERNAASGGASANAAKASVILFDPRHLDTLRNIRSNLIAALNDLGLKTSDGHYVIHASRSKSLIEMGVAAEKAYRDSAREFIDNYEAHCQEWASNLGDDYDAKLYPAIDKVAHQLGVVVPGAKVEPGRKRGFVFSMNTIAEHDESMEVDMGLSLTDDEREFIAQGARAHYQSVVDQAFDQLRDAMGKIVEGDQKGRRVRVSTVDNANRLAEKIEAMGIDTRGVAAKARVLTSKPAPVRSKNDKGRDAYTAKARAILGDLEALAADQGGE